MIKGRTLEVHWWTPSLSHLLYSNAGQAPKHSAAEGQVVLQARKKKPNKLMSTMRDIFGSHDIDPDRVEREAQKRRGSKRDIKRIDLNQVL